MKREVSIKEEELRLQNSSELMYGNNDHDQLFPFDKRMRFKYLVYHEAIGFTEDGQQFSKKSTRRFTFISASDWDNKYSPKGQMSFFEKQQKVYTILHDPLKQAELEGVKIKGYHADRTGLSLAEKLRGAKPAAYVAREVTSSKVDEGSVTFDAQIEDDGLVVGTPRKAGRPKKEEVSNG